ncbi:MAG TPA: TonB family protein, partial [Gemmatimonadaceae bacterium]|nr:TonB family protein [Gemmatimonadaceae bacterium]
GRGDRQGAQAALSAAMQTPQDIDRLGLASADAIIRLGTLYQDAGLHAEAERLFAEALVVGECASGADDIGLVPALTKLGTALIARGAHDEAEPPLMRALMISETQLGVDSPDLIVLLNDLSRLYLKQAKYSRAEPLLQRLLAFKRSKGDDHPEVATVLASIAVVRQALGDHDAAEQLYRRVLQIRERTLSPNHFGVAAALEHLAEACAARGKVSEALALFQRALSVREQTLGVNHASLRVSRERIADLQLQASEESLDAAAQTSPMFQLHPAAPRAPSPVETPRVAVPVEPPRATRQVETPRPAPTLEPPRAARPVETSRAAVSVEPPPAARPVETARVTMPVEPPRAASPVALPPEGVPASLRAMSQSVVSDVARSPMVAVLEREAAPVMQEDAVADYQPEEIVVTSADGFFASREVLKEIEAIEAAERKPRDIVASLKQLLPASRVQAAIVGAGAVALLIAALAAQPDATSNDTRLNSSDLGSRTDSLSVAAVPVGNGVSQVTRTSNGALVQRSVADVGSAQNKVPEKASASLELSNVARTPIANIATLGSDSIVRSATSLNTDGGASAIQLIASGSEKKLTIPDFSEAKGTRTSAKLRGELPQPVYPAYLRQVGVQGEVLVRFVVDENGRPDLSSLKVVRSPHEFLTDEVRRVIMRLSFDPARTEGPASKPRSEWVQMSFVFDPSGK